MVTNTATNSSGSAVQDRWERLRSHKRFITRVKLLVEWEQGGVKERANAVLNESRRILEETRQELTSALESGRQTLQQRADRGRGSLAGDGETNVPGDTIPPAP